MLLAGLSTFTVATAAEKPFQFEYRDGVTHVANGIPYDVLLLTVRDGESSKPKYETVLLPTGSSKGLRGKQIRLEMMPIAAHFTTTLGKENCKALALGGNLRADAANVIAALRSDVEAAATEGVDTQRNAMMLKIAAANDEFQLALQDPTWDRAADQAFDNDNYALAGRYMDQGAKQDAEAASMAFAQMAAASLDLEFAQRDAWETEADQMERTLKGIEGKIEKIRAWSRRGGVEAEAGREYAAQIAKHFASIAAENPQASAPRRQCNTDAYSSDVLLVDSPQAKPAMLRIRFDRGGSIDTIAFPTRDAIGTLAAKVPVPAKARRAEVYAGRNKIGEVDFRARSLDKVLDDAIAAGKTARKAARSARYLSQGGSNIDSGATVW